MRAEYRLFEGEIEVHLYVLAAARPRLLSRTERTATEKGVEEVPEAAGEHVAGSWRSDSLGVRPEHVVSATALGVAQGFVGDGQLLELGFRFRVTAARVRMEFTREFAVGAR